MLKNQNLGCVTYMIAFMVADGHWVMCALQVKAEIKVE